MPEITTPRDLFLHELGDILYVERKLAEETLPKLIEEVQDEEFARELEKQALADEYFHERKLYPNVDYYSGIIYEALGVPNEMFTVIFAIPRTAGWVAQWMEMKDDPEQKIARPRQIYTGERERGYVAVEDREGPEKIIGPPARRPKRPRRGA